MGERVWVVCREWRDFFGVREYEIAGIYSDEARARAALGPGCWLTEVPLDTALPSEAPSARATTQKAGG